MKKKRQPETKESGQRQPQPATQIKDLPPTNAQSEQTKGGMLLPSVQKVREAAGRSSS